jgi:hypothetical protein
VQDVVGILLLTGQVIQSIVHGAYLSGVS